MDLIASPAQSLQGEVEVPGDKSISHRVIMLGSIAENETIVHGFLQGDDCLATLKAMQACGVKIQNFDDTITIQGVGLHGLQAPKQPIDCGNSGTSMRLLAGLMAGQNFSSTLIGDASLSHRPMERIIKPLTQMGAKISGQVDKDATFPPIEIAPSKLHGIDYTTPMASAQVKSCVLLASLYADSPTFLVENTPTRDHTERLLQTFGASIICDKKSIRLRAGDALRGQEIYVPGDISSAAFFIAGASFVKGAHIIVRHVGVNPRRAGIIQVLKAMGADITLHNQRLLGNESIADIEVKGKELRGIDVSKEWIASAIDEFPVIFVAAACANGETTIRGIQELRFKETDRIVAMAEGLKTLGVALAILPDGIIIRGSAPFNGGEVDSFGDHRVAMAFTIASLMAKEPIKIKNCQNIATSFPNFVDLANQLGLSIQ